MACATQCLTELFSEWTDDLGRGTGKRSSSRHNYPTFYSANGWGWRRKDKTTAKCQ